MALRADQIDGLVAATLDDMSHGKLIDLASKYQNHVAMPMIKEGKNVKTQEGGTGIQWTAMMATSNKAKNTGLFATDTHNVSDNLYQARVPWRLSQTQWEYDVNEVAMNAGSKEKIVDLVETRKGDSVVCMFDLMESNFWDGPSSSSDQFTPNGVPYWIVKNATTGFNGGNPTGLSDGAGGLDSGTHENWKNYTGTYGEISVPDLIRSLKTAMYKTNFKSPIAAATKTKQQFGMYTTWDVVSQLEEVAESRNDNLGSDLAKYDGEVTVRRVPIVPVPYLDENTDDDPIYGIDWNEFSTVVLKGRKMVDSGPITPGNMHNVRVWYTDITYNFTCRNRRRQFVLYNA